MRIGELATAAKTTARTIRYYEEIGLLDGADDRPSGGHRVYTSADLDRLRDIMRLRDLLGVPLEELRELIAYEDQRPSLKAELESTPDPTRKQEILNGGLAHIERQLELVRQRRAELQGLEDDLTARKRRIRARLRSL